MKPYTFEELKKEGEESFADYLQSAKSLLESDDFRSESQRKEWEKELRRLELIEEVYRSLTKKKLENGLLVQGVIGGRAYEDEIEEAFRKVLDMLCVMESDLNKCGVPSGTPHRITTMYRELFSGLSYYHAFPSCTAFESEAKGMVTEAGLVVKSMCEHHFMPISGHADVGYIPKGKVLGLSKFSRIVNFYSRRPQIQERLSDQIMHALCVILGTEDVVVRVTSGHACMSHRGANEPNAKTTTVALSGEFERNPTALHEFYKNADRSY